MATRTLLAFTLLVIVIVGTSAPTSFAAPDNFVNKTVGQPFWIAWNGSYNYSHNAVWEFNVTLAENAGDPPLIVSIPFEFSPMPRNSQSGPVLKDIVYFNGQPAEWSNLTDSDGIAVGNEAGAEWDLISQDHAKVHSEALHAGQNNIKVVANLTFTARGRSGLFNATLGPIRVTSMDSTRPTPAFAPLLVGCAMIVALVLRRPTNRRPR